MLFFGAAAVFLGAVAAPGAASGITRRPAVQEHRLLQLLGGAPDLGTVPADLARLVKDPEVAKILEGADAAAPKNSPAQASTAGVPRKCDAEERRGDQVQAAPANEELPAAVPVSLPCAAADGTVQVTPQPAELARFLRDPEGGDTGPARDESRPTPVNETKAPSGPTDERTQQVFSALQDANHVLHSLRGRFDTFAKQVTKDAKQVGCLFSKLRQSGADKWATNTQLHQDNANLMIANHKAAESNKENFQKNVNAKGVDELIRDAHQSIKDTVEKLQRSNGYLLSQESALKETLAKEQNQKHVMQRNFAKLVGLMRSQVTHAASVVGRYDK